MLLLSFTLVCISWGEKNSGWSQTGRIPRNSISHFTCSQLGLKRGKDLERAREEGEIKGVQEMNHRGLLRPSVNQYPQ